MSRIVVADIGGTHARFAIAELATGERPKLGPMTRSRTRDHPGLASAWAKFAQESGGDLPRDAAIAVAAPIEGETLRFMNSDWRIPRFGIADEVGLDRLTLLNDYGALGDTSTLADPSLVDDLIEGRRNR